MTSDNEGVIDTADVIALIRGVHGGLSVLLVERRWAPFAGHWALPGGHVDPGEHPRDAAARELAEETGVAVDTDRLIPSGVYDTPGRDPRGPYRTTAYRIELVGAPRPVAADDARAARWVPVAELAELPLAFDHREILAGMLQALPRPR